MKVAVLEKVQGIKIQEQPEPVCGPDDVVIKMRRIGICGSDVHFWKRGAIGSAVLQLPWTIGHESTGDVVEVGANVTNLKVGDRVAPEPGACCGECFYCRTGRYNLCPDCRFQGAPTALGCQAEYIAWPASWTYKLPDDMSYEEGALVEPLNVSHYAVRRGRVQGGETVLVTGAGTIGQCAIQAAAAYGAARIISADMVPGRLELARTMGATDVIDLNKQKKVDAVLEMTDGLGVDATLECSGAEAAVVDAVMATRRGGRIVMVGMFHEVEFVFPIMGIMRREIDLIPSFRYANAFKDTMVMLAAGRFPHAAKMVTHRFPLEKVETAIRYTDEKTDGAVKVMITLD